MTAVFELIDANPAAVLLLACFVGLILGCVWWSLRRDEGCECRDDYLMPLAYCSDHWPAADNRDDHPRIPLGDLEGDGLLVEPPVDLGVYDYEAHRENGTRP